MSRVGVTSGYYGTGVTTDGYGSAGGGTGFDAMFIPQLYAKKALRNFYKATFYDDISNTDYQGVIKSQGDTVIIRRTPEITVRPYEIGGTLTYEVPKKDATNLVIDRAVYTAFKIDDIDAVQSDLALVNMFAEDAGYKMKIEVDREVLAYMGTGAATTNKGDAAGAISESIDLGDVTVGTSDDSVAVSTTNAITKIVEINQVLDEANQPSENRWIVLPAWYVAMLKLGDLRRADVTGDSTGEAIINYAC